MRFSRVKEHLYSKLPPLCPHTLLLRVRKSNKTVAVTLPESQRADWKDISGPRSVQSGTESTRHVQRLQDKQAGRSGSPWRPQSSQFSSDLTQSEVKTSNLETCSPVRPSPLHQNDSINGPPPPHQQHSVLFHLVNYGWRGPVFLCPRTGRCPLSALYCTCTHHAKNTQQNGMLSKTSDRSAKV